MKLVQNLTLTLIVLTTGIATTSGLSALIKIAADSQWQSIEARVCERSETTCNRRNLIASK